MSLGGNPTAFFSASDMRMSRFSCDITRSVERSQGIGSAVVDLIFSIAKRDVTFFSGTVAISFL